MDEIWSNFNKLKFITMCCLSAKISYFDSFQGSFYIKNDFLTIKFSNFWKQYNHSPDLPTHLEAKPHSSVLLRENLLYQTCHPVFL